MSRTSKESSIKSSRKYSRANRDAVLANKRRYYAENSEEMRAARRAYYHKNIVRSKAHKAVSQALKSGTLSKVPCRDCGAVKVEGHHEDYNKPLDVIWLCHSCHMAHHASQAVGCYLPSGAQQGE